MVPLKSKFKIYFVKVQLNVFVFFFNLKRR